MTRSIDGVDGCPTPQDAALVRQWSALQSGFRRLSDQLLCDVAHSTGLAPSSFQVLWFLSTTPGRCAPMNQLSEALGFSTAGTTKVADRLTATGLLERRPDPADRRVIIAALTEEGWQVAGVAASTLARALRERVIEPLGEEQFTAVATAISGLGVHLTDQPCPGRTASSGSTPQ